MGSRTAKAAGPKVRDWRLRTEDVPRARTISLRHVATEARELKRRLALYPEEPSSRPTNRAECAGAQRPCPFVSCRYHLYIDVNPRNGSIKLNFPDVEVWDMTDTCALDVADRGGSTFDEVGAAMNLTRQRVDQIQVQGLAKLDRGREQLLAWWDGKDERR